MRKLFVAAMVVALLGAGGYTRDASAVPILSVVQQGGSQPILPGGTAVFDVLLNTDVALIAATWQVGVIGGGAVIIQSNTSNPAALATVALSITPGGTCTGNPPNSCTATAGVTSGSFGGLSLTQLDPGTYDMGNITIQATGAGAASVAAGELRPFLDPIFDEWFDANQNQIPTSEINAAAVSAPINVIPEPGTASLLGLGLMGLVFLGRRRS